MPPFFERFGSVEDEWYNDYHDYRIAYGIVNVCMGACPGWIRRGIPARSARCPTADEQDRWTRGQEIAVLYRQRTRKE